MLAPCACNTSRVHRRNHRLLRLFPEPSHHIEDIAVAWASVVKGGSGTQSVRRSQCWRERKSNWSDGASRQFNDDQVGKQACTPGATVALSHLVAGESPKVGDARPRLVLEHSWGRPACVHASPPTGEKCLSGQPLRKSAPIPASMTIVMAPVKRMRRGHSINARMCCMTAHAHSCEPVFCVVLPF